MLELYFVGVSIAIILGFGLFCFAVVVWIADEDDKAANAKAIIDGVKAFPLFVIFWPVVIVYGLYRLFKAINADAKRED